MSGRRQRDLLFKLADDPAKGVLVTRRGAPHAVNVARRRAARSLEARGLIEVRLEPRGDRLRSVAYLVDEDPVEPGEP